MAERTLIANVHKSATDLCRRMGYEIGEPVHVDEAALADLKAQEFVGVFQPPYDQAKDAEKFAQTFSSFVNNMNRKPGQIAIELLMREHRTIQQNMMRFFMLFVASMAKQSHDMRNEASVRLAQEIIKIHPQILALPHV